MAHGEAHWSGTSGGGVAEEGRRNGERGDKGRRRQSAKGRPPPTCSRLVKLSLLGPNYGACLTIHERATALGYEKLACRCEFNLQDEEVIQGRVVEVVDHVAVFELL